jgi:predicted neuraminidase
MPTLGDSLSVHQTPAESSAARSKLTRRSLLSAALLGWGYWVSSSTQSAAGSDRKFLIAEPTPPVQDPLPRIKTRWIEHQPALGFVHCASLSESASRQLTCTWYGGSREGARDVNIWMSQLDLSDPNPSGSSVNEWNSPVSIMDIKQAGDATSQFVKKVGNSLVFHDMLDRLWMVYVSIAAGGWSTSSLNATCSTDGGRTWSVSERLWLSPSLNVSELVRCPAIMMQNGEVGIPIYHECAGVFPEMLWLRPGERNLDYHKSRLCGGRDWLQPSVVPTGQQTAICYLRCANNHRRVGYQTTFDAGQSWSRPELLNLPNPNSAVCGVMMSNSAVLLALNNSSDKRDSLSLMYSANGIDDWRLVAKLDDQSDKKFSYPTMIRDRTGVFHLVYSWQMKKLRHVSFNEAWVHRQLGLSDVATKIDSVLDLPRTVL